MSRGICRTREGKTLIELLVVIITMSAILSTAGQMLYRLSRAERAVRDAGAIARAEIRLYRTFREDARAAETAMLTEVDGRQAIVFSTATKTVTYRATDEAILRSAEGDGGTRRDSYRLGATNSLFRVENDRFAALTVKPRHQTAGRAKAAAGEFQILAALGKNVSTGSPEGAATENGPVEAARPEAMSPAETSQPDGDTPQ
ncbi:MAG: hypothetical protein M3552_19095 [Planctomycetota bacterium]|nr:hypothetical protein [Planctomycetaceae bacterium]MDQ3332723.1 hypothetical protein [Planctomycetota bacterium]